MNRRPQQLSAELTRSILESSPKTGERPFFVNHEVGIVRGAMDLFGVLRRMDTPFSISDYRMGLVVQGEVRSVVNLTEQRLSPGSMAFIGPGTIVQPLSVSPDFCIKGMSLFPDFPLPFAPERMPPLLNGQQTFLVLHPSETDLAIANQLLDTAWTVANLHYDRDLMAGIARAVLCHWNRLYLQQSERPVTPQTREQEIFDRFLRLASEYATREHHLPFYASRLCLTPRYLSSVVRKASGTTAKEWIDRALITAIKVRLRHSSLTLQQIADETAFPNPSFFNKYFRRLTGQTLGEYRSGK